MNSQSFRLLLLIGHIALVSVGYGQRDNDILKQILSHRDFTLVEHYMGDWGGYDDTLIFKPEKSKISISLKGTTHKVNNKRLIVLITVDTFNQLVSLFMHCNEHINTSDKHTTEHIMYEFKKDDLSYIIDDKYTMACNEAFQIWKASIKQSSK